jgi:hypothetical protein
MSTDFDRKICGDHSRLQEYEWVITDGNGLLISALKPLLEQSNLLLRLDQTVKYGDNL